MAYTFYSVYVFHHEEHSQHVVTFRKTFGFHLTILNEYTRLFHVVNKLFRWSDFMVLSSNGNVFCVTGPLCGEFTGHRWIPLTKASDAEL